MTVHFIDPLDVLFLRGNRLFGDAGSYGESMVPPWPSAAAGAIRSAILVRDGVDLSAFARGDAEHATVGTRDAPGTFRITDFQLAWHGPDGKGPMERLYPLPADLVATKDEASNAVKLSPLAPVKLAACIASSGVTPMLPVMAQESLAKPVSGLWLTERGLMRWLAGDLPNATADLVRSEQLWKNEERVGIGMDVSSRRAEKGKLFTVQAVALGQGVGFVASVEGDALADGTMLRFGGDGRGAVTRIVEAPMPETDFAAIAHADRCRIILSSPGVFPEGWRLPGMDVDGRFELLGVRGRVSCAAVPRAEVISGWNLARWRPKPAQRAVPAGSVYWIEDLDATPEALRRLVDHGLWPEQEYDRQRRAEGFNRFMFAKYELRS